MRKVIDTLIVLMLVTLIGGLVWHYQQSQRDLDQCSDVQEALTRMYEQTVAHATVDKKSTQAGFPTTISANWFGSELPMNVLAADAPWVDMAPKGDMSDHPPDPILDHPTQAGFWYNANRGLIRARVPRQVTDLETVNLYNKINQSSFKSLRTDPSPERAPVALDMTKSPSADMSNKSDKPARGLGKADSSTTRASADDNPSVTSPAPRRRTLSDVTSD
ncbi:MAG: hypothetical protein WD768_09680 [Phycisphaeraceae bacterium]